MKAQRLANVLLIILVCSIPATAQYATSKVKGIVRTDSGAPLPSARIGWIQQGKMRWFETDSAGEFSAYFVDPGFRTFRFEHPSVAETGTYFGLVPAASSLVLTIVLEEADASGSFHRWRIREELPGPPDVWKPAELLTKETIETFPSTEHLWAFLNQIESSVVTDKFDIAGLHSDRQFMMGVRGSSRLQNYSSLNGISVNNPNGNGMLVFPDVTAMETIVYGVGDSPSHHAAPGAHVEMTTKSGDSGLHGEARLFFQSGSLQNSNVTPRDRTFEIYKADELWKQFFNGGVQLSGPVGKKPWSYFAAFSGRDLTKWIRTQPLPVSGMVTQQTYNVSGSITPIDQVGINIMLQNRHEPQSGASMQIRRDASVDQRQTYRNFQGSWTHDFSSRRILIARFGVSPGRSAEQFQSDAVGQSAQDLFPGYAVDGVTPHDYLVQNYGRLINTTRGPAPLITNSRANSVEGSLTYSVIKDGFWNSKHRLTFGASLNESSIEESKKAVDDVNLLFFEGLPNAVRLLNSPSTRDHISDMEFHVSDNISISRFSFLAEVSAKASRFFNVLASGQSDNANYWRNVGGRLGVGIQVIRRVVIRTAYAQIFDQANLKAASTVNREGLQAMTYSWNDLNGDLQYQPGENTQLLKVTGGGVTQLDQNLKNPKTSEFTFGVAQNGLKGFHTEFFGFRRTVHNPMSLVNEGVPYSSFVPIQVTDPSYDVAFGTSDDHQITVFNQKADTLGKDRYLLTNPTGYSNHSEGFEFSLGINSSKIQASTTVTRYRAVAASPPGLKATENDTGTLLGVFDNPNNAIFAQGSTFFDRGTLLRMWVSLRLPAGIRAASIGNYQDGLPYALILPVSLNQGVIGVLTSQRGPGNSGTTGGFRTQHYQSIDARFSKDFKIGGGMLTASMDIFNLSNLALNLVQTEVTSHHAQWRVPLQFQTPRSFQPGLRYRW